MNTLRACTVWLFGVRASTRRRIGILAIALFAMMLGACATNPSARRIEHLFSDHLFPAREERISSDDVFAVSEEMKHFIDVEIVKEIRVKGSQLALVDALRNKGRLSLEYDSVMTRNASEAFEARSGNCLSLAIMTAAFARQLGLTVRYQSVFMDDLWSRSGDIYFSSGHVNLTLGTRLTGSRFMNDENDLMTIDFLPPEELRGQRVRVIREETVIAMYMNNRAAELLARGQLGNAYWWAREAIRQDPRFLSAYNTLGVIYRRHGNMQEAERILRHVIEREPENTNVMANLALVLNLQGRAEEAGVLSRKLAEFQPYPAFHFFDLGMTAMRAGNFAAARDLFEKEVNRAAYYHEFHFWLAIAHLRLGEIDSARKHLTDAMDSSASRRDYDLYAAKRDLVRSSRSQKNLEKTNTRDF